MKERKYDERMFSQSGILKYYQNFYDAIGIFREPYTMHIPHTIFPF
jgi:hypothetical protein